jgi:hypothetical protein
MIQECDRVDQDGKEPFSASKLPAVGLDAMESAVGYRRFEYIFTLTRLKTIPAPRHRI